MHREWITWVHHPHTLWSTTFPSRRLGIDCRGVISWISFEKSSSFLSLRSEVLLSLGPHHTCVKDSSFLLKQTHLDTHNLVWASLDNMTSVELIGEDAFLVAYCTHMTAAFPVAMQTFPVQIWKYQQTCVIYSRPLNLCTRFTVCDFSLWGRPVSWYLVE